MAAIPFLGRWSINTYFRVGIYFALLVLEQVARFLVAYTPLILLVWVSRAIGWSFNRSERRQGDLSKEDQHFQSLMQCRDVDDFTNYWGYPLETHLAITPDGYVLAIHRIPGPREEAKCSPASVDEQNGSPEEPWKLFPPTSNSTHKPVVLLWHGFMMCSEVWICHTMRNRSLAFVLADLGYDVWIANSRGNKYSCKHVSKKPSSRSFWDFSMDEIVQFDVPTTVDVRRVSIAELSYVGFSQGTAQAFASLSLNPTLNSKVNVFCALAPAAQPQGLTAGVSYRKCAFLGGNHAATPMGGDIERVYAIFVLVEARMDSLEGQDDIIRNGSFQMFDEEDPVLPLFNGALAGTAAGYVVPKFPLHQIKVPVALLYGGSDSLANM
ncbi:hypothetical protein HDU93_000757, partial [Gonapodya sp. JEL0774]